MLAFISLKKPPRYCHLFCPCVSQRSSPAKRFRLHFSRFSLWFENVCFACTPQGRRFPKGVRRNDSDSSWSFRCGAARDPQPRVTAVIRRTSRVRCRNRPVVLLLSAQTEERFSSGRRTLSILLCAGDTAARARTMSLLLFFSIPPPLLT